MGPAAGKPEVTPTVPAGAAPPGGPAPFTTASGGPSRRWGSGAGRARSPAPLPGDGHGPAPRPLSLPSHPARAGQRAPGHVGARVTALPAAARGGRWCLRLPQRRPRTLDCGEPGRRGGVGAALLPGNRLGRPSVLSPRSRGALAGLGASAARGGLSSVADPPPGRSYPILPRQTSCRRPSGCLCRTNSKGTADGSLTK